MLKTDRRRRQPHTGPRSDHHAGSYWLTEKGLAALAEPEVQVDIDDELDIDDAPRRHDTEVG